MISMEEPATPTPQPNNQSEASNTPKVLIIEDEYFISELYVRALRKANYNVVLTVDGKDGLEKALTNEYDIILLDIMVPTVTGNEILDELRKKQPPIKAKIIVTTNLEQSEKVKEKLERLADGYIIKAEITPKQLVDFIGQLSL